MGISGGHYVGLDRLLDILGTLHHLPQLFQQLCCDFWTHLPTCNWNKAQKLQRSSSQPWPLTHSWRLQPLETPFEDNCTRVTFCCVVISLKKKKDHRIKPVLCCSRARQVGTHKLNTHTHTPSLLGTWKQSSSDMPNSLRNPMTANNGLGTSR